MNLGICAIIKDEREDYLREWINFHLLTGFDFIYIFDNGSELPLRHLLSDLDNVGIAWWPGNALQYPAYNYFINRLKNHVKWTAFIDSDEFVIPRNENCRTDEILSNYEEFSGLGVNWLLYGSNGLIDNKGTQIEAFKKRANNSFPPNNHIKSIVKLNCVKCAASPHHFVYSNGFCVNEQKLQINGPSSHLSFKFINHKSLFHKKLQ